MRSNLLARRITFAPAFGLALVAALAACSADSHSSLRPSSPYRKTAPRRSPPPFSAWSGSHGHHTFLLAPSNDGSIHCEPATALSRAGIVAAARAVRCQAVTGGCA